MKKCLVVTCLTPANSNKTAGTTQQYAATTTGARTVTATSRTRIGTTGVTVTVPASAIPDTIQA